MKLEFCVLVLSLLTFSNVYGDETQDTNTVVVPLETDEDPANRQTVYTVIGEIGDDIGEIGEEIYKDVQEKIASVPTPDVDFESVYNSVPGVDLESVYDSVPDVDLYAAYDTLYDMVTSIDLEPITRMATKSATNFIAIAPSIAIVGFVGVGLYLMTSLALRAVGFAVSTKLNTLRLASDVLRQAPEFVSRMMTGDARDSTVARLMGSTFHNDQIQARSDIPQPFGLMNLLAGAQKVSEAIDKYNNLNQE